MSGAIREGLVVRGLTVEYHTDAGVIRGADEVGFSVRAGERLGIVGESGSGKSTTALALMRMIRPPGRIAAGSVRLDGIDLLALSDDDMRSARLRLASYIPQGAMNSLNPVKSIGGQIADAIIDHETGIALPALRERIAEALAGVDLAPEIARAYPHQLSGGMKQRVCIAIGMVLRPRLIVADEPTSALDVVTQLQVMETLGRRQQETECCFILIGHDMGLMAQFVDRLAVMYAGRLVELGAIEEMFSAPLHPYTRMLIASVPSFANRGNFVGIPGTAPSLHRLPTGCAFAPRCPQAMPCCREERPEPREVAPGRVVACHFAGSHAGAA
jgi:oligopeptide/dipeptide ABC transporter ATP-binding protein